MNVLFLDIGGVLMTNGWDHVLRKKTAEAFHFDYDEMDVRHQLLFDAYEKGKMSFDDYLKQVIFFEKRPFTLDEVKQFIFNDVKPFPAMIDLVKEVKHQAKLKVVVLSNEGRELALDRIQRFDLSSFVDFFVVSSFVHLRKPDPAIYQLAIDVVQNPPSHIIYIDDRKPLVEAGQSLGLHAIHHTSVEETKKTLRALLSVSSAFTSLHP